MNQSIQEIKEDIDFSIRRGYQASVARCAIMLANDNRLNDNFETALSALIEHHGADSLTSLAAVMRHYSIKIDSNGCGAVREGAEATHHLFIWEGDEVLEHKWAKEKDIVEITANDIKPEK